MPPKKIALISDAWDPQVNGVVTTFKNIIPLLNKKGFDRQLAKRNNSSLMQLMPSIIKYRDQ